MNLLSIYQEVATLHLTLTWLPSLEGDEKEVKNTVVALQLLTTKLFSSATWSPVNFHSHGSVIKFNDTIGPFGRSESQAFAYMYTFNFRHFSENYNNFASIFLELYIYYFEGKPYFKVIQKFCVSVFCQNVFLSLHIYAICPPTFFKGCHASKNEFTWG